MTKRHWKNRITLLPGDPNRRIPPRMQYGNPPKPVQRPFMLAHIKVTDDPTDKPDNVWMLALLRAKKTGVPDQDDEWMNCKLYVRGPDDASAMARHKANFWVSFSAENIRLNRRADTVAMEAIRPKLYAATVAALTQAASWAGIMEHCPVYVVTDGEVAPHPVMSALLNTPVGQAQSLVTSQAELRRCVEWVKERKPGAQYRARDLGLDMWQVTRVS